MTVLRTSAVPRSDGNGRVTLPDLAALAEQAHSYSRKHAPHEPLAHFECACMLRVYDAVARPGGTHHFVAWCGACLVVIKPPALEDCDRQCSRECVRQQDSQSAVLSKAASAVMTPVIWGILHRIQRTGISPHIMVSKF